MNYHLLPLVVAWTMLFSCTKQDQASTFDSNKTVLLEDGFNMSYREIGNASDPVILLLHGEPSYSLIYRNIAPTLAKKGYRVIAPDLIGFGNSDKPTDAAAYTYSNHTKWLQEFIKKTGSTDIRLYAHDWGGMIALRIVAQQPDLFSHVAVSYAYLYEGTETIPESFKGFQNYAATAPDFLAGNIMDWGSKKPVADSIKNLYNLPYQSPEDSYGMRAFPSLIPTDPKDPEAILNQRLNQKLYQFDKPFTTIWGNHLDSMWVDKDKILQQKILGAQNQKHYILDAGHFLQEDQPAELTNILVSFFAQ
ncbi:MAG: alpha/beta fold hydrolase [Reichenbachiella sp.]